MTAKIEPSCEAFATKVADITRDFSIAFRSAPAGPPRRIDGYTIGAVPISVGPEFHLGEVHPDGDEFLLLVSGALDLILDDGDEHDVGSETKVPMRAGDAYIVPRGIWHRIEASEPGFLVHVTPGPNGGHRPLN
jgi:mannose-6-phosphate isomerase-like protein (cupin superfamily)